MKKSPDRFEDLLQCDEFAGHIIRWVAIFEIRLDFLLSAYFVAPHLYGTFADAILGQLSFRRKIEILKALKLNRPLRSRDNIVNSLGRLLTLRNALAHSSHMSPDEVKKLRSDKWIYDFVSGYPKTVGKEKNALENRFSKLWNHFFQENQSNNETDAQRLRLDRAKPRSEPFVGRARLTGAGRPA